ncbi:MAG: hypothetical protein CVU88_03600, partial [Firmicutes bacterium HGW-Firmicutes-13]
KGSGRKRLVLALLVFLLILAGGAGGIAYFRYWHHNGQDLVQEDPEPEYKYFLENFIVNLAEQRRYLKIGIVLSYFDGELGEELDRREPQIKDKIIDILWGKSLEEIYTDNFLQEIKGEIVREINSVIRRGKIEEVYFTEFIIQ